MFNNKSKIIWFKLDKISNLDELKKEYRNLSKHFHPDTTQDDRKKAQYTENMKQINNEYDYLKQHPELLTGDKQNNQKTAYDNYFKDSSAKDDVLEELKDIVSRITHLEGINIEICGSWIWVNSPKQYKEYLKYLGFLWNNKKQLWYFRRDDKKWFKNRKQQTMDNIRDKYGSQEVKTETLNKIA